ncbi:MAG TPA: M56 family metallopeptidase [Candidatus Acidoferrales bacterium]|nr:M56 family metallopeptidase [Candidatus Acidoferrales bacterium]
MNAMQILASGAWVERLGWTLVHFLWQGLSIAVLYAAARRGMARTSSPNARYLLACAALAVMMAAPLLTFGLVPSGLIRPSGASPDAAYRVRNTPPAASTTGIATTATLPASVRAAVSAVQPAQFLPWVVMVWLAGAVVFWVRLAGGWVVAARMRSVLVRRAPPEWQEILWKLGARIGLSRPVRLLVSALVQVPTVVGWLRPVVLVPVGALGGLPAEHLEALLLHELAHIRRHDYLVNILQSAVEALLFYHPAVWWVSGHIRAERELCCDDVAVSVSGDALTYARALTQLESYRPAHRSAAVAANGGSLAGRIARLLGQSRPAVRTGMGPGALAVAILLVGAAYGLFGQSGAHPAFQTASIKPNTSDWSERTHHSMGVGVGYQPGGPLTATDASLMLLIQFSYAAHDGPHWLPLPASQVVGGPAWINSLGYDIEAKAGDTTDPKQAWLMWQTLLADRFKLRLHRETKELPIYDLTALKSGPKLPAAKAAVCVSFPPGTPPRHVPGKVDCGYVSGPFSGSTAGLLHIRGRKVHIADLIRELALVMDRPILDKTGLADEFDLNLSFTPDGALIPGFGWLGDSGGYPPADPKLPNIFTALEEQLGLKLTSAKGPVGVLVVDHAEKPATN